MKTVNCSNCAVLVWESDIPSKKSGRCWRCEIRFLQDEVADLRKLRKELRAEIVELSRKVTLRDRELDIIRDAIYVSGEVSKIVSEIRRLRSKIFSLANWIQWVGHAEGCPSLLNEGRDCNCGYSELPLGEEKGM